VVVKGNKFFTARRRETLDDLFRVEKIVKEVI